ncbi:unnamed protein product, partial [Amoebophrya sp. A25]
KSKNVAAELDVRDENNAAQPGYVKAGTPVQFFNEVLHMSFGKAIGHVAHPGEGPDDVKARQEQVSDASEVSQRQDRRLYKHLADVGRAESERKTESDDDDDDETKEHEGKKGPHDSTTMEGDWREKYTGERGASRIEYDDDEVRPEVGADVADDEEKSLTRNSKARLEEQIYGLRRITFVGAQHIRGGRHFRRLPKRACDEWKQILDHGENMDRDREGANTTPREVIRLLASTICGFFEMRLVLWDYQRGILPEVIDFLLRPGMDPRLRQFAKRIPYANLFTLSLTLAKNDLIKALWRKAVGESVCEFPSLYAGAEMSDLVPASERTTMQVLAAEMECPRGKEFYNMLRTSVTDPLRFYGLLLAPGDRELAQFFPRMLAQWPQKYAHRMKSMPVLLCQFFSDAGVQNNKQVVGGGAASAPIIGSGSSASVTTGDEDSNAVLQEALNEAWRDPALERSAREILDVEADALESAIEYLRADGWHNVVVDNYSFQEIFKWLRKRHQPIAQPGHWRSWFCVDRDEDNWRELGEHRGAHAGFLGASSPTPILHAHSSHAIQGNAGAASDEDQFSTPKSCTDNLGALCEDTRKCCNEEHRCVRVKGENARCVELSACGEKNKLGDYEDCFELTPGKSAKGDAESRKQHKMALVIEDYAECAGWRKFPGYTAEEVDGTRHLSRHMSAILSISTHLLDQAKMTPDAANDGAVLLHLEQQRQNWENSPSGASQDEDGIRGMSTSFRHRWQPVDPRQFYFQMWSPGAWLTRRLFRSADDVAIERREGEDEEAAENRYDVALLCIFLFLLIGGILFLIRLLLVDASSDPEELFAASLEEQQQNQQQGSDGGGGGDGGERQPSGGSDAAERESEGRQTRPDEEYMPATASMSPRAPRFIVEGDSLGPRELHEGEDDPLPVEQSAKAKSGGTSKETTSGSGEASSSSTPKAAPVKNVKVVETGSGSGTTTKVGAPAPAGSAASSTTTTTATKKAAPPTSSSTTTSATTKAHHAVISKAPHQETSKAASGTTTASVSAEATHSGPPASQKASSAATQHPKAEAKDHHPANKAGAPKGGGPKSAGFLYYRGPEGGVSGDEHELQRAEKNLAMSSSQLEQAKEECEHLQVLEGGLHLKEDNIGGRQQEEDIEAFLPAAPVTVAPPRFAPPKPAAPPSSSRPVVGPPGNFEKKQQFRQQVPAESETDTENQLQKKMPSSACSTSSSEHQSLSSLNIASARVVLAEGTSRDLARVVLAEGSTQEDQVGPEDGTRIAGSWAKQARQESSQGQSQPSTSSSSDFGLLSEGEQAVEEDDLHIDGCVVPEEVEEDDAAQVEPSGGARSSRSASSPESHSTSG